MKFRKRSELLGQLFYMVIGSTFAPSRVVLDQLAFETNQGGKWDELFFDSCTVIGLQAPYGALNQRRIQRRLAN